MQRDKVRRSKGIEYDSMDGLVVVTCAGVTKSTHSLVGEVNPEWNDDLVFNLQIPPGDIEDIQHWLETQSFEFSLFDYDVVGLVPYAPNVNTDDIS